MTQNRLNWVGIDLTSVPAKFGDPGTSRTVTKEVYWSELMNPKICIQIVSTLYPWDGIGTEWGRCSFSHDNERKSILLIVNG